LVQLTKKFIFLPTAELKRTSYYYLLGSIEMLGAFIAHDQH